MKGDFPLTISPNLPFAKTISRLNIDVGARDRVRAAAETHTL